MWAMWFVMICQLIRPAGGWSVWWELCSWLQGGKEGFTTLVLLTFQEVFKRFCIKTDLCKTYPNVTCHAAKSRNCFCSMHLVWSVSFWSVWHLLFFLIFFAFVSVDILPLPYPSVYTVALLCRCPEALKEESPGRAGAAGLDTLVSGIPELYNGRTTTLCAAKIYAKDLHLTKSYSHTCF